MSPPTAATPEAPTNASAPPAPTAMSTTSAEPGTIVHATESAPVRIAITGLGFAHPPIFVPTEEVCAFIGVPREWGPRFRGLFRMDTRPLWWENGQPAPPEWPGTTLAIRAGRDALTMSCIDPGDVTHLITVACTPDQVHLMADAHRIRRELALTRAQVFQFDLGCGGIANALFVANQWLATGIAQHVLIVPYNTTSAFMKDAGQRAKYIAENAWFSLAMFNDSAGAMLLSGIHAGGMIEPPRAVATHTPFTPKTLQVGPQNAYSAMLPLTARHFLMNHGGGDAQAILAGMLVESGVEPLLEIRDGGANNPTGDDTLFRLHSNPVRDLYGPIMLEVIERLLTMLPGTVRPADCALIAVHQANGNVVDALRGALSLPKGDPRVPIRTPHLGNSVAASTIEILLSAVKGGRLKDGDLVCIASIGAGMSAGGIVLRWGTP